jgi:two-component system sensor histidine kinase SenX3
MRKENQHGTNQIEKRSNVILDTTNRLALMFDSWLDKGRVESALNNLSMVSIKLQPFIDDLVANSKGLVKSLTFEVTLNPEIKNVKADKALLDSALSNLIENAIKYSPNQSTISIKTLKKAGFVGIAITDQGIGIAAKHHNKVFTEYFRVAPEGSIQGTGLGLPLVNEIVKAHNGEIELKSKLNKGSTFTIWIPN